MPKRRMTPARRLQIQKWQYAGRKARTKDRIPTGKTSWVFHHTSKYDAMKIVKQQKFKRDAFSDSYVYGSRPYEIMKGNFFEYGSGVVGFKVPRKMAQEGGSSWHGGRELRVHRKNVLGRRLYRIL